MIAPQDIVDLPAILQLDELEAERHRLVEIREVDGGERLVRCRAVDGNVDRRDLPLLGVDEGIALERRRLLPFRGPGWP